VGKPDGRAVGTPDGRTVGAAQESLDRAQAASSSPSPTAGTGCLAAAYLAAQPGAGSTSAASATTTGKVKLVDGTTVYVETSSGDVVTVRTNGQTTVESSSPSSLKDLAAGDSVIVQGQSSGDGQVTATTVTETK
jgi:hypothetical protein